MPADPVVHQCPPDGEGLMPCCGRTPWEVPKTDLLTNYPDAVTCDIASLASLADTRQIPGMVALANEAYALTEGGQPDIPAEAAERLAVRRWPHSARTWDRLDQDIRGEYLAEARADLEAAAPLLQAHDAIRELEALAAHFTTLVANYPTAVFPEDSQSVDAVAAKSMRHAYTIAARDATARARQLREGDPA